MSKQVVEDLLWKPRLDNANKYYKEWSSLFKCDILERYYEGEQWKDARASRLNPYVINKIYETIQIKIAEFVPTYPVFHVSPKPASSEFDYGTAVESAQVKEDCLNTIISDQRKHFTEEIEAVYKDSFTRFGIMEVDYAADWFLNPNAEKPLLKSDTDKYGLGKNRSKVVKEPRELPTNERVYFKHVRAKNFRVGGLDHKYLDRCDWVGYFEYIHKDDLLSFKIMNRDKVENSSPTDFEHIDTLDRKDSSLGSNSSGGLLKVWKLWDLRSRMKLMVLDSPCVTIMQRKFKRIPFIDYRPDKRMVTDGFYPIPPVFHWLSPQDELNEIRDQLRNHRRRFVRKFVTRIAGGLSDDEIEKFESGPDGTIIKSEGDASTAIVPVQNADLGSSIQMAESTSADDLNRISGTSDNARGISDRGTATEAKIVEQRGAVRETKEQLRMSAFLSQVGREILLTCKDKFTIGMWAMSQQPEGEDLGQTVGDNPEKYKWISAEELNDGYDFKIDLDVTSLSSTAAADEKQNFIEFLSLLAQFPSIAFSPILVREAAYKVGYRNSKVLKEMQKMALMAQLGRERQLQGALGQPQGGINTPPNGNAGQQQIAAATPPLAQQIQQQHQQMLKPN